MGSPFARRGRDGRIRPADHDLCIKHGTSWEARLSATASGKVATGGVGQFSIGPRILSSGTVGLFSTIALTYDADTLINNLLTPPTQ